MVEKTEKETTKIFGIGFHKTGTSSLKTALQTLGFSVKGPFGTRNPAISTEAWELAKKLVPKYDAFQDNPWPLLYPLLDEEYEGSKFILTVREPDSWLKSMTKHFGGEETAMRKWIYGCGDPLGNEETFLARYHRHNNEAMEYFEGREGRDFLVMRLTEGDGWERLCPFLGLPTPGGVSFPHRNRAKDREARRKLRSRVRRRLIQVKENLSSAAE